MKKSVIFALSNNKERNKMETTKNMKFLQITKKNFIEALNNSNGELLKGGFTKNSLHFLKIKNIYYAISNSKMLYIIYL